ncbi:MAG: WD40 repeat domain-containing protein [Planctomycetota bacterium]
MSYRDTSLFSYNVLLNMICFAGVLFTNTFGKLECKYTPLWDVRGCDDFLITHKACKNYELLKKKTRKLIKRFRSYNAKKRRVAYSYFRRIIPFVYRYIKRYVKQPDLPYILHSYANINYTNISEIKVICEFGDKFMWYSIIDKRERNGLLLVGDERGPLDLFPISFGLGYDYFSIEEYSCDIIEGIFKGYAIEVRGVDVFKKDYHLIVTNRTTIGSARLLRNKDRTRYILVRETINGKRVAIIDGKETREYDNIWSVVFSPDNKSVGFIARKGEKELLVIDGEESKEYAYVSTLRFSSNNKKVGFTAYQDGKQVVVIDGKENKEYDYISTLVFSPDGNRVAFVGFKKLKWFVVIDDKESKGYDWASGLEFSSDSKKVGFIVGEDGKRKVIINGEESGKYDLIWALTFSPDSSRAGFIGLKDGKEVVVVDGKESKEYDRIWEFKFSPDSKRVGIIAKKGDKYIAVIDDKESSEFTKINSLVFSSNGKRAGFIGEKNRHYVAVVDNNESEVYDGITFLDFSPDEEKVGIIAKKDDKYVVVINEQESDEYERIINNEVRFVNSGKDVVFLAEKEDLRKREDRYLLVINGEERVRFKNVSAFIGRSHKIKFIGYIASKIYSVSCNP